MTERRVSSEAGSGQGRSLRCCPACSHTHAGREHTLQRRGFTCSRAAACSCEESPVAANDPLLVARRSLPPQLAPRGRAPVQGNWRQEKNSPRQRCLCASDSARLRGSTRCRRRPGFVSAVRRRSHPAGANLRSWQSWTCVRACTGWITCSVGAAPRLDCRQPRGRPREPRQAENTNVCNLINSTVCIHIARPDPSPLRASIDIASERALLAEGQATNRRLGK